MKQIMQDKYILGQSINKAIEKIGQEIRIDLSLKPNPNNVHNGKVYGKVLNKDGDAIENALVKIMSADYEPLMHDITDNNGTYSFLNIPPNTTYNIFAISEGMKLKQANPFTITQLEELEINFILEEDPFMKFGVIAGDIIDQNTDNPISGAVVGLFEKNSNSQEELIAVSYTNEYGQYVFREVPKGNYIIRIGALGYKSITAEASITADGQIIPMTVHMTEDPNTSRGTVSGIITDNNNRPIDRADVILYKVQNNGSLVPLSFTKTNETGVYLFANVPQGNYKVKSNQVEIVSTNVEDTRIYSPNFSGFSVNSLDNYVYLEYMMSTGKLENGAKVVEDLGYVKDIGGSNNGSVSLIINAPLEGKYNLAIMYLSGDDNRQMKISLNNSDEKTYTFLKTDTWDINHAKMLNLTLNLNKGENLIKFYNDTGADSPHIKYIGLTVLPFKKSYDINQVNLYKNATLENNLIKNIGQNLGYVVLDVNIPSSGVYNFTMKYVTEKDNNKSNIEVNEISSNKTYTFSQTKSLNTIDAKEKNILLTLNKGINKIKIYNN